MGRKLRLLSLLVCLLLSPVLAADPDGECLSRHYSRYSAQHIDAFLLASEEMEARLPDHYPWVSEFIEFQIRSAGLKAHAVSYLTARSPEALNLNDSLAKLAAFHHQGRAHHLLLADEVYRHSFPRWQRDTQRFIHGSGYSKEDWQTFVEARNIFNRILSGVPQYPALLEVYRTRAGVLCKVQ